MDLVRKDSELTDTTNGYLRKRFYINSYYRRFIAVCFLLLA